VEPTSRISDTDIRGYRLVSFRLRPLFLVVLINVNTFSVSPL
jgi:hypothetical protein